MKAGFVKTDEVKEAPYHMGLLYYVTLQEVIRACDIAAVTNDNRQWYRALRALYRRVEFKMEDKEVQDIENYFQEAHRHLNAQIPNGRTGAMLRTLHDGKTATALDTCQRKLFRVMDKYGMIMPKWRVRDGIAEIREAMKLQPGRWE